MSFRSINRVVLVGRLTRDPELRALPSGTSLCSLRIACNGWRKNADGSYQAKPNFFNVSVFGPQAESVSRYMRRGSRVAVDGRLEWSEWQTAEDERRQAVDVVAERVEFLERPDGDAPGHEADAGLGPAGEDPGEEPGRDLAMVGAGIEDDVEF